MKKITLTAIAILLIFGACSKESPKQVSMTKSSDENFTFSMSVSRPDYVDIYNLVNINNNDFEWIHYENEEFIFNKTIQYDFDNPIRQIDITGNNSFDIYFDNERIVNVFNVSEQDNNISMNIYDDNDDFVDITVETNDSIDFMNLLNMYAADSTFSNNNSAKIIPIPWPVVFKLVSFILTMAGYAAAIDCEIFMSKAAKVCTDGHPCKAIKKSCGIECCKENENVEYNCSQHNAIY